MYLIIIDGIAVGSTVFNDHLAVGDPQIQCVEDTPQVQRAENTHSKYCDDLVVIYNM